MLQSIQKLYADKLGAADGEIGHVKDFYFDDQSWAVRYLVAETGSWLTGRQVLLSPHAFGGLHQAGKILSVDLTRKQIEDSPVIETHRPVSRQYEMEYNRYYGWPFYWEGDGLWGGMRSFPTLSLPANLPPTAAEAKRAKADAHLHSTQAVKGYNLQATDGIIGHVSDFMMDSKSWAIRQLVVRIGHRFTGPEVFVATDKVLRISYDDSTVFVNLTQAELEQTVPPIPALVDALV
jgi:hypothetical protein